MEGGNIFPNKNISSHIKFSLKDHKIADSDFELMAVSLNVLLIYIIKHVSQAIKTHDEIRQANDKILSYISMNDNKVLNVLSFMDGSVIKCSVNFNDAIYDSYIHINKNGSISKHLVERINITLNYYILSMIGKVNKCKSKIVSKYDIQKILKNLFSEELYDMIINVKECCTSSDKNDEFDSDDIFEQSSDKDLELNQNDYNMRGSIKTDEIFDSKFTIESDHYNNNYNNNNCVPILNIISTQHYITKKY